MSDTVQIVSLLKAINDAKTKVATVNGNIGDRIKKAIDNNKVCAKALKRIADEIRMSEDVRNDYVRSLNHYRIIAEEAGLLGDVHEGDIVDQAENGDSNEADQTQQAVDSLAEKLNAEDAEAAARNSAAITSGIKKLKGKSAKEPRGDASVDFETAAE